MADAVPTQITQYQTGFAPEIAPYGQALLGSTMGSVFQFQTDPTTGQPVKDPTTGLPKIAGFQPYQQYQGERFAQFTPMQQQAFTGAQGMQAAPQLEQATALAGQAGLGALGYGGYQPTAFKAASFTQPGMAQRFMNPYMEQVLSPQLQAMQRQADIQRQTLGAQAAQAGGYGGARAGLMGQQLNAELMRQQQQATGQAYGTSFQQAQQQFNAEQAARQAAAQLREQSRQYGAGLGLQGLQTALQGAQQLGALGQTQFGQQQAINQLQAQYGAQQQQQMQNILGAQYQDFLNAQNYPYKQLGFMSDILRGAPLTQTGAAVYQAPPSALATVAGLGGLGKATGIFAEGGKIEEKPAGLADLALYNMGR